MLLSSLFQCRLRSLMNQLLICFSVKLQSRCRLKSVALTLPVPRLGASQDNNLKLRVKRSQYRRIRPVRVEVKPVLQDAASCIGELPFLANPIELRLESSDVSTVFLLERFLELFLGGVGIYHDAFVDVCGTWHQGALILPWRDHSGILRVVVAVLGSVSGTNVKAVVVLLLRFGCTDMYQIQYQYSVSA